MQPSFCEERMIAKVIDNETSALPPLAQRPRVGVTLMLDRAILDDHVPRYGMNRTYFEAIRRAGARCKSSWRSSCSR